MLKALGATLVVIAGGILIATVLFGVPIAIFSIIFGG